VDEMMIIMILSYSVMLVCMDLFFLSL